MDYEALLAQSNHPRSLTGAVMRGFDVHCPLFQSGKPNYRLAGRRWYPFRVERLTNVVICSVTAAARGSRMAFLAFRTKTIDGCRTQNEDYSRWIPNKSFSTREKRPVNSETKVKCARS